MGMTEGLLLGAIVFFAGMVRGCIGFGFSSLVVSSASLFISPILIVPMLAMLEIVASVHMAFSVWRDAAYRPLIYMLIGTAIATPMGIYLLVMLPADMIRLLVSVMILLLSVMLLSGWQYKGKTGAFEYSFLGIISGVCNGAAAVGGLPVAAFLTAANLSIRTLRATLVLFFLATDIILLLTASGHGLLSEQLLIQSAVMILPMAIGIHCGSLMFSRISEQHLRTGVISLLILLSVVGITRVIYLMMG